MWQRRLAMETQRKVRKPVSMYRQLLRGLFLVAIITAPSVSAADDPRGHLPKIEADREQFFSQSRNQPGSKVRAGVVFAKINAPAAHVEKILQDYGNYRHFLPFFTHSGVLGSDSQGTRIRLRASILKGTFTAKATVLATKKTVPFGGRAYRLNLVKGNVKRMDASFTVYPLDEGSCLVHADLLIDPDIWFVRDKTLSRYNKVNARRTMRSLRKRLIAVPFEAPREAPKSEIPSDGTTEKVASPKTPSEPAAEPAPTPVDQTTTSP